MDFVIVRSYDWMGLFLLIVLLTIAFVVLLGASRMETHHYEHVTYEPPRYQQSQQPIVIEHKEIHEHHYHGTVVQMVLPSEAIAQLPPLLQEKVRRGVVTVEQVGDKWRLLERGEVAGYIEAREG
jgi:hypothetical protein